MKNGNWKNEKLQYTRCSELNVPAVGADIFYKWAHTIRNKHLAPCTSKEVHKNGLTVFLGDSPEQTMGIVPFGDFFFKD